MKHSISFCLFIYLFLLAISCIDGRSIHRRIDYTLPKILAYTPGSTKKYTIASSHLELYPTFRITAQANYQYALPHQGLFYGPQTQNHVKTETINACIENLLLEIENNQTTFTDFTMLHKKDFNSQKKCGFIVLKFNEYPLVLKLSLETPETFVDPYSKGFIPKHFFFMAGGSNRHMSGLTRIKNLHILREKVAQLPQWSEKVIFPNKWFWMPKNPTWIEITGENIGGNSTIQTSLPCVYGIITEFIEKNTSTNISKKEKKKQTIKLCNDLDLMLDPHITNFIFKKDPITNKETITIIDTEHFPTITGIREKTKFTGHNRWYIYLAKKCIKDMYFRTKKERLEAQTRIPEYALF